MSKVRFICFYSKYYTQKIGIAEIGTAYNSVTAVLWLEAPWGME